MKKIVLLVLMTLTLAAHAQKKKTSVQLATTIPLTSEKWSFKEGTVEFTEHKGQKVMKVAPGSGQVVLKDVVFRDGTIEFDVEPILPGFAQSVYFHRRDAKEQEIVYLRLNHLGNKMANEAIQYTPYFDGINMWDMYPQYQAPAPIKKDDWNHLKLVISGKQMQVYMNHLANPVLQIPELEGNIAEGSIAFEGAGYIANVKVIPGATEGLSPRKGFDLTNHDANYLRKWALTQPVALAPGSEAHLNMQPDPQAYSDSISAERGGFINLTRKFGGNNDRKVTWLKTTIVAKAPVITQLQLGFSDEVWVFLNQQTIYVDKNLYAQGMRKYPGGRMSIQNSTVDLDLKAGENVLVIAVANDFYGWGIAARLRSTESIASVDNISGILQLARESRDLNLDPYLGVYSSPSLQFKLTFTKKDRTLVGQASGQEAVSLQFAGRHTFRFDQVVIEFRPSERKLILREGGQEREFVRE